MNPDFPLLLPRQLQLFDSKTFTKGSFLSFAAGPGDQPPGDAALEFSPCGKYILYKNRYLLDAFDGEQIVEFPVYGEKKGGEKDEKEGEKEGEKPQVSESDSSKPDAKESDAKESSASGGGDVEMGDATGNGSAEKAGKAPETRLLEAHFSADSDEVMQVSQNPHRVCLFSTTNAQLERTLVGFREGSLSAMWNPSKAMIVTANGNEILWWV